MLEWINLLSNCSTKRRIVRCFGCLDSVVRMRVSNFFSGYSSTGLGRPKKRCGTFPGHHSLRRTSKAFFSNLASIVIFGRTIRFQRCRSYGEHSHWNHEIPTHVLVLQSRFTWSGGQQKQTNSSQTALPGWRPKIDELRCLNLVARWTP